MNWKHYSSFLILIMLLSASVSSAERFTEFLDFESSPVGPISGDFGRVFIASSPQGVSTTDCNDIVAAADGRAITPDGSPSSCSDRSGVRIVDSNENSRDGILILDFAPTELPDSMSFEVHQGPLGSTQGVELVEVRYFGAGESLLGVQTSQDAVALHEFSASAIKRVEVECHDGFTLDNLFFSGPSAGTVTAFSSDDLDNRNSQIFSFDLVSGIDSTSGPVHDSADLETLILDPQTSNLYGITAESGELWSIDKTTGDLTSICTIPTVRKFREIAGSSFHPTTGDLWAYQYNRGLVILDLIDCSLTRPWNHSPAPGLRRKWDGIAWRPDGSALYASQLTDLIVWDPVFETATVICSNLPKKTEGLEYAPDGRLLGSSNSKIYEIDPETCTVTEAYDLPNRQDIESLTFE